MIATALVQEDRFQKNMDSLPPELYNMVFDFTFCAGPTSQSITGTYKSPSALQVSRATRAKFEKGHYSLTTFKPANQGVLRRWVKSLAPESRERIERVYFNINEEVPKTAQTPTPTNAKAKTKAKLPKRKQRRIDPRSVFAPKNEMLQIVRAPPYRPPRITDPNRTMLKRAQARLFFVQSYLGKRKLKLPKDVVYVNVKFDGMEEEVWTKEPGEVFNCWKTGGQTALDIPGFETEHVHELTEVYNT